MPIVRTDIPITAARCNEYILQLANTYPACRTEQLTASAFQRPIRTLTIGNGPRKVLYTAAHHANEWITALILLKFGEDLAAAIAAGDQIGGYNAQEVAQNATIYMVPMVDPDGVDLVVGAIAPGTVQYETARTLAERYPAIPFPDGWKANLLGVDLTLQYPPAGYKPGKSNSPRVTPGPGHGISWAARRWTSWKAGHWQALRSL